MLNSFYETELENMRGRHGPGASNPAYHDLVQRAVAEDLRERFMICYYDEIVTALREVACLIQTPGNRESIALDGCVALFGGSQETKACEGDLPAIRAACWDSERARAVLLQQEVPDPPT